MRIHRAQVTPSQFYRTNYLNDRNIFIAPRLIGDNDFWIWTTGADGNQCVFLHPVYFRRKFLIREYGVCVNNTTFNWVGDPMYVKWPTLEIGIYRGKVNADPDNVAKKLHSKKWSEVDNIGFYSHKFDPPMLIPENTLIWGAVLQVNAGPVSGEGQFSAYATRYANFTAPLWDDDWNQGTTYAYSTKGHQTVNTYTDMPSTIGNCYRVYRAPCLFFRERNQRELAKVYENFEYFGRCFFAISNDETLKEFVP